jgi:hypothetical protein
MVCHSVHVVEVDRELIPAGSVARAGPNLLIINDAELYKKITSPRSRYSRTEWNESMKLDPRIDNTISELDEKRHSELRYKVSHGVCLLLHLNFNVNPT